MRNFLFFVLLVVAFLSAFFLLRLYREQEAVTKELRDERYGRMVAEELVQKEEYRVKKLEAELQGVQKKLSRTQEAYDKEKEASLELEKELEEVSRKKTLLERDLQDTEEGLKILEAQKRAAEQLAEKAQAEALRKAVQIDKAVQVMTESSDMK